MEYILLAVATLLSSGKSIIGKRIGTEDKTVRGALKSNALIFALALLPTLTFALILGGGRIAVSLYSVILAALFALSSLVTQISQMQALASGSTSSTTLVFSAGFLVPTFYGHFALGERIALFQIIGILILSAALYLIISPEKGGRISFSWLVLAIVSALGSGANAIIQKMHQSSQYKEEFYGFLVLSFVFAAFLCFGASFAFKKTQKESKKSLLHKLPYSAAMGLCVGFLNILNLTLAGKLPAVIQFPIYNIGGMILTGVLGAILFGEKNTKKQLIGFGIGCVSILIIGLT